MCAEGLWNSNASIRPCYIKQITVERSARCCLDVVVCVVTEVGDNQRRDCVPITWLRCHKRVASWCTHRARIHTLSCKHIRDRRVLGRTAIKRDVQVAMCVSLAHCWQEGPAAGRVDTNRPGRHRRETTKAITLQVDIPAWSPAGIVPDNAHCPCTVADGDTWEVVHRETVIAGDERGIHRDDVDRVGCSWSCAGCGW